MRAINLYRLGLQLCGIAMLVALAVVSWGFFAGTSQLVLVLVAIAAIAGVIGVGLVGYGYFIQGSRL